MKLLHLIFFGFVAGTYAAAIGDFNNATEHLDTDNAEADVDSWHYEKVVAGEFTFTKRRSPTLEARFVRYYGIVPPSY
ncbi:hypothetical protein N8T08_010810 [Aspergillus melleus]|uniref:Uncharacterized protein n=1 Tax=Aspergillus melleus TaxID=138277 RepID=A0ACC3BC81_9EURO|nr:hypothetical protein N8T08_010810 [Aspergillus melleus]